MPDLRFPSIDGLRAFEAAARLGTFEKAAEELAVTASAVGKRIATVEELLGTPLFQRGPRLSLTPAGKEYLTHVRAALGLLAAAPQHRRHARRVQRLRVSTPPTFARQILVPELPAFTEAHPRVELEVVLSIPFLDDGGSDADVQVRHGDAAAVGGTVLMHDVVLPVAAPSLLARLPRLRTPADLAHAPLLRTPLEPWAPWFAAAGLPWPEPDEGPRLLDLGLTLEAALGGQGVALARPSLARAWLENGALIPLFDVQVMPAHQYYVAPHAASGAAPQFAQWLQRACERIAREAVAVVAARRAPGA
ncbi:LysR substrate-binding domain-containing protein [Azohydromonas caseinilytica]|uniref:LysR family transcriptional regulator n=1 Tax=Azohydromonas caseinilytica TaxID=2728836 RepID=A0A848F6J3_9BURK|nr:LysR substrate-binding domain-containing protein [Azohydromonas caseinilytica]NML14778.1 LysR family transcriptional regulator [Azohydromonas caseinilytica]